jgi:hypothetical protein
MAPGSQKFPVALSLNTICYSESNVAMYFIRKLRGVKGIFVRRVFVCPCARTGWAGSFWTCACAQAVRGILSAFLRRLFEDFYGPTFWLAQAISRGW